MSARVFSRNSAFICARARYDNSEKLGYSSESESTTAQESELTVSWFSVRAHFTLAATIQLDSTLAAGLGTRIMMYLDWLSTMLRVDRRWLHAVPGFTADIYSYNIIIMIILHCVTVVEHFEQNLYY